MFDHRNHEAYPINSSTTEAYVKANLGRLKDIEKQLKEAEVTWTTVHKRAAMTQSQIGELINIHIQGINEAEEALIAQVRKGSSACIAQLKKMVSVSDMTKITSSVSSRLSRVKSELKALQQNKANFNGLSTLQKLQMLGGKKETPEPVHLGALKQLRGSLALHIDYKAAVKHSKISMSH